MDANDMNTHEHAMETASTLLKQSDATHIAVQDGNWSNSNTWSGGRVPGTDSLIHIPSGISITYDVASSPELGTLRLEGSLAWTHAHDTEMLIETIVTLPGSSLEVGSEGDPIPANVTADITFRDTPISGSADPERISHGLVAFGEVDIEGAKKESFITLEKDAKAGDKVIKVDGDLANWKVGDKILVVGTEYVGEDKNGVLQTQDEERTITAIDGDLIMLDESLAYDHQPPAGMDVDLYVGNLSRNVTFQSENPEGTRGHVMMHNSATDGTDDAANSVRYAAFDGLGRTDKTEDITASNPEGRYPLHLHMTGTDVDASTSVLQGNSVSGSPGWGIVQHSSRALINDNLVYDITGGGIVSEAGDETGAWMRNLVTSTTGYDAPNKNGDGDQGAAYENQSRVIVQQDNIAANSKLGWNFSGQEDFALDEEHGGAPRDGIHRKMFEREQVKFDPSPFDVALDHEEPPIVDFVGNEVIGTEEAFRVYHRQFSDDTDTMSVIRDFTVWGGDNAINLKNYSSNYEFIDSVFQGSGEGFRVEQKTSAVVFNNVEFRDFGTGYHSYGVSHESVLIDVDFVNVANEFKLEDLMKNMTNAGEKQALVDYYRTEYGIDYNNAMPEIVDSADLDAVAKVTFVADKDADLTIGGGDKSLNISGKIYDSVGERVFNEYVVAKTPSGALGSKEFDGISVRLGGTSGGRQLEFTFDEFLAEHGTYQKSDGSWVSPVVNWITDRLTAKQHPVVIEIKLKDVDIEDLRANELDAYPNPGIDNENFDYGFEILGADQGASDAGNGADDATDGNTTGGVSTGGNEPDVVDVDEDSNDVEVPVDNTPVEDAADDDKTVEEATGGDTSGDDTSSGGATEEETSGDGETDTSGEDTSEDEEEETSTQTPAPTPIPQPVPVLDESADEDGDLALSYSFDSVDLAGSGKVTFQVSGIDDDASAKLVVWNSEDRAKATFDEDGDITLDLSGFDPNSAYVKLVVSDDDGNQEKIVGSKITIFDGAAEETDLRLIEGNGTLRGSGADEAIHGGGGKDVIYGRGGDDELYGNAGENKLYGQGGRDTFVFNQASLDGRKDDVKDFDIDMDVLAFRNILADNPGDLNDWLRVEKSGTTGILQVDATGSGSDFEDVAILRNGRGLTIDKLIAADAIEIM